MNIPVFDGGRIVAVAGVGNKAEYYEDDDVRQLTLFMDGMWRILCRKQAEEQLQNYAAELEATNKALEKSNRLAELRHPREERVPGQHEPRNPHADDGHSRFYGPASRRDHVLPRVPTTRMSAHVGPSTHPRNGEHLLGVINDILDLSKIEAGKFQIEPTRCSPVQLVAEVVSLMRPQAAAKQLKLKTELACPLPETVLTDPLRLRQVLVNLVGNAIKFTDQGEIRLAVRLISDSGSPRLCFDVTDTGIGMNEEQIGKLFQAVHPGGQFVHAEVRRHGTGALHQQASGRGPGRRHRSAFRAGKGQHLQRDDRPGAAGRDAHDRERPRGPARSPANSDRGNPGQDRSARPDPPGRGRAGQSAVDLLLLRKAGAEVTAVENGQLAVEAALAARDAGEPFDVILMDMQMPVMDGYEATRQLRKRGYTGPIVALTAHAMVEDCQKCLDAGCDDYLPSRSSTALLEMRHGISLPRKRTNLLCRIMPSLQRPVVERMATHQIPQPATALPAQPCSPPRPIRLRRPTPSLVSLPTFSCGKYRTGPRPRRLGQEPELEPTSRNGPQDQGSGRLLWV